MQTLFPTPRNTQEARTQANILSRAEPLLTTGGYTVYNEGGSKWGVYGPDSSHRVDLDANTCTCEAFGKYGDCKHRLALVKQLEMEAEEADDAAMWESICAEHDVRMEEEGGTAFKAATNKMRDLLHAELTDAENTAAKLNSEPFAQKSAVQSWMQKANRCLITLRVFDETLCKMQLGRLTL